jgi:translation elongation factor EF-1alpha
MIAVTLPGTTPSSACIGVTSQTIYDGTIRKLTPVGPIAAAVCYGTVNAGSIVDNCTVTNYTGRVQAHVATSRQLGIALAQGLDGETIPLILSAAANA